MVVQSIVDLHRAIAAVENDPRLALRQVLAGTNPLDSLRRHVASGEVEALEEELVAAMPQCRLQEARLLSICNEKFEVRRGSGWQLPSATTKPTRNQFKILFISTSTLILVGVVKALRAQPWAGNARRTISLDLLQNLLVVSGAELLRRRLDAADTVTTKAFPFEVAEGVASGDLLDDLDLKGEGLAVKSPDEGGVGGNCEGLDIWKEKKTRLESDDFCGNFEEEKLKILRLGSISLFEFWFVAVLVFGDDQKLADGFQRRFAL
jgi:hypothetical protein